MAYIISILAYQRNHVCHYCRYFIWVWNMHYL